MLNTKAGEREKQKQKQKKKERKKHFRQIK